MLSEGPGSVPVPSESPLPKQTPLHKALSHGLLQPLTHPSRDQSNPAQSCSLSQALPSPLPRPAQSNSEPSPPPKKGGRAQGAVGHPWNHNCSAQGNWTPARLQTSPLSTLFPGGDAVSHILHPVLNEETGVLNRGKCNYSLIERAEGKDYHLHSCPWQLTHCRSHHSLREQPRVIRLDGNRGIPPSTALRDPRAGSRLSWWCHTQSMAVGGKSAPQCHSSPCTLPLAPQSLGHQRDRGDIAAGTFPAGLQAMSILTALQVIINRLIKSLTSTSA